MAVLHRALCTWFICLIFLILLVLRLDNRTRWSWFIVFIPMWLYDSVLLLYLTFNLVTHCKRPHNRTFKSLRRKIWNLTCALLKLVAQIMLCLKLELEVPNSNFKCSSVNHDFVRINPLSWHVFGSLGGQDIPHNHSISAISA